MAKHLDRLMGVEPQTVPVQRPSETANPSNITEVMENEIRISGTEAVYRLTFTHAAP